MGEDEGTTFLRNVGKPLPCDVASEHRSRKFSHTPMKTSGRGKFTELCSRMYWLDSTNLLPRLKWMNVLKDWS